MRKIESLINLAKDEDEVIFIKMMVDIIERTSNNNYINISDFLDPGQIYIVKCIVNTLQNIAVYFDGGYENAERKRAIFIPSNYDTKGFNSEIAILKMSTSKFSRELTHRDFLGSLLGLGIKRKALGDIIITEDNNAFVITMEKIKDYLLQQLEKVSREYIKVQEVDKSILNNINIKNDYEELDVIVSTMRLDGIISSVFKISRNHSSNLINQKRVKVNFRLEESNHCKIEENTLISVKGFGRCKIEKLLGKTRKERNVIHIKLYK